MSQQPLDLNILPERYRPRRISTLVMLAVLLATVIVVGLLLAYNTLSTEQAQTANLREQLTQLRAQLRQDNPTEAQQAESEQQLEQIEEQITDAHTLIDRFQTDMGLLGQERHPRSDAIVAAVDALVPRVHLTGVSQQGRTFILSGEAGSQGLVLDFSRALHASGQFANVRILSMVNSDPLGLAPDVRFSISTEQ